MITIILTIFNKEKIIKDILMSLFTNSSTNINEYIFILDGCVDNSEIILKDEIKKLINIKYKILYADNVFEIKANNLGLKEVSNEYAIIVQDDMLIKEKDWDKRLILPIKQYTDIWAVTARTSCTLNLKGEWINLKEGPVGHNFDKNINYPRNIAYVGQVINRGPLLVKMDVIKKLGYLDENLPGCIGCDDADLCFKAFKNHGLRCCSFWIGYYSPLEWGSTRTGPNTLFCQQQELLNKNEVIKRYPEVIKNWNYDEERTISSF